MSAADDPGVPRLTIWKYPFAIVDEVTIYMPKGARVLHVESQGNVPCIWALVNPDAKRVEQRVFRLYGTGHTIPDDGAKYLGTFQMRDGRLVWHLFEGKRLKADDPGVPQPQER